MRSGNQSSTSRIRWFLGLFVGIISVMICLPSMAAGDDPPGQIDMAQLNRGGDTWKIIEQGGSPADGFLRLNQTKWLMYFLHWRPLTQEPREVTPEYVRDLLLSFWGPNMPFILTGNEGPLTVAGHPAYFVEGTIYKGTVKTRFIVWDCPRTGRRFIADTNINVQQGTPEAMLDLQRQIAQTTCCHGQEIATDSPVLTQDFKSEKFNLSFRIPPTWRTREYPNPKWFPDGQTPVNGTLWTLITDSEKRLELYWRQTDQPLNRELFDSFVDAFRQHPLILSGQAMQLKEIKLTDFVSTEGRLVGNGVCTYSVEFGGKEYKQPYIFRSFLWRNGLRIYFLMASMVAMQEMWQIPNDLTPDPGLFDRFVKQDVLPSVIVFK